MRALGVWVLIAAARCSMTVHRERLHSRNGGVIAFEHPAHGSRMRVEGAGAIQERVADGTDIHVCVAPGTYTVSVDGSQLSLGFVGPGDLVHINLMSFGRRLICVIGDGLYYTAVAIAWAPIVIIQVIANSGLSGGVHIRRLEK